MYGIGASVLNFPGKFSGLSDFQRKLFIFRVYERAVSRHVRFQTFLSTYVQREGERETDFWYIRIRIRGHHSLYNDLSAWLLTLLNHDFVPYLSKVSPFYHLYPHFTVHRLMLCDMPHTDIASSSPPPSKSE